MNFTHDCNRCVFLGEIEDKEGKHDLYICPNDLFGGSLIARFGNEGPEYRSFGVDANVLELFENRPDYVLSIAYRKAVAAGYRFKRAERGLIRNKIRDARWAKIGKDAARYQKLCQEIRTLRLANKTNS
jgi:hypothetical protein